MGSKKFKVNESTVRANNKSEKSIQHSVSRGTNVSNKVSCFSWYETIEKKWKKLSIWIIQEKARLFEQLKPDSEFLTFQASKGWLERFKNRSGLHNVKILWVSASADHETAKYIYLSWRNLLRVRVTNLNKFLMLTRQVYFGRGCLHEHSLLQVKNLHQALNWRRID